MTFCNKSCQQTEIYIKYSDLSTVNLGDEVAIRDILKHFNISNNPQLHRGVCLVNHGRDIVALSAAEHQTAKLFEPEGRVFGRREMSLCATVEGIEQRHAPLQLPPFRIKDCHAFQGFVRNDGRLYKSPGFRPSPE